MNDIGNRRMPCGHHRVDPQRLHPTDIIGDHNRRCDICRTTYTFTISVAREASAMTRLDVYRIDWQKPEKVSA